MNKVLFRGKRLAVGSNISNKRKITNQNNNKSDVELLEDLTDITLKFVPVYEQTIAKVGEQIENPRV